MKKMNEIVLYNIISIVILMNIFQLGLAAFGISFNAAIVEYVLILFSIIAFRDKVKNRYNIFAFFACSAVFLLSIALAYNDTAVTYLKEFMIFALPLLLIFIFEIDYSKLLRVLYRYMIIGVMLYILNIIMRTSFSRDYMTFGYGGIFCSLFIFVFGVVKRKKISTVAGFLCSLLFTVYGPRGGIIVIVVSIILLFLLSQRINKRGKIVVIVLALISLLSFDKLISAPLDFINANFDSNLYAVKQLNNMKNMDSIKEILSGRYSIFENAISEIRNNSLFGMGIGSFHDRYGYFAHNIFLDVYSTFGIIFGSFYFILLARLISAVIKICKNESSVKIFIIFCLAMSSRLLLSKTFVYDPYIWLLIAVSLNVLSGNRMSNNRMATGVSRN